VSSQIEPIVVTVCPPLPVPVDAALADVLVVAGGPDPTGTRCVDFFVRFPGLSLVLIPARPGVVVVGFRGGATLKVRMVGGGSIEAAARVLFACWVARPELRELTAYVGGSDRLQLVEDF
jgi:hypothetical protein